MSERTILFVCLHGAAKSLIAARHLERLAKERGMSVRATFAGTEPDPELTPAAVAGLEAEGIDVRGQRPRRVTGDDIRNASRVVSFGCELGSAGAWCPHRALGRRAGGQRELPRGARRHRVPAPGAPADGAHAHRTPAGIGSRVKSHASRHPLLEIGASFLTIGALSYGGPAIMGIMQAEIQEKRQWVSRERFVEGLALVNALPGPAAAQLALFLGHARGGAWGAIAAGLGFILPAFFIMLALTWIYSTVGTLPAVRGTFYGIGPVVLGIFAVAIYRLGTNAITDYAQVAVGLGAAAIVALSPIGLVPVFLVAGALGIYMYHPRRNGLLVLIGVLALSALLVPIARSSRAPPADVARHGAHAAPDPFVLVLFVATVIVLFLWRVRPLPLMVAGGVVGIARRALRFGDAFLVR